jgi:hypothetical protein
MTVTLSIRPALKCTGKFFSSFLMPVTLLLCFSDCGKAESPSAAVIRKSSLNRERCGNNIKEVKEMNHLDKLIERFREGEEYSIYEYEKNDPLMPRSISDGRPDCFTLNYLENRIQKENDFVSIQIVNFLEDLAVHTDPFNALINRNLKVEMGYIARLVRDESTISILMTKFLKGKGDVQERCYEILHRQVPGDLLLPHTEKLLQELERRHFESLIDLLAKAKPHDALERIRSVFSKRNQTKSLPAQIAMAALGDGKIEQVLIQDFLQEKDPREKISKGNQMADIGTPASIYALASEMRTPLVSVITGALARSVRIELIPALRFALPLAEELYYPIESDADYIRIEKFLEKSLGVKWERERPPYLTILPLPPGFSYKDGDVVDIRPTP